MFIDQSCLIWMCNSVSATFGIGKLKAFNKFKESSYWRSGIKTVCDDDIEIDRVVEKVLWKGCGKNKVTRSSTRSNVQFTEVYTNDLNTTNKSSILLSYAPCVPSDQYVETIAAIIGI